MTGKYVGAIGKSFEGDRDKAVSYQGVARVLVQQGIDRIKAHPFKGKGQQFLKRVMPDGTVINAYVNMLGIAPIIRTWIESPMQTNSDEMLPQLVYALFDGRTFILEVYRISVEVRKAQDLEGAFPFFIYNAVSGAGTVFSEDFDLLTVGADFAGGNAWEGVDPITKTSVVVTHRKNKIYAGGQIIHEDEGGDNVKVFAAALDFNRSTRIGRTLVGRVEGVGIEIINVGESAPLQVAFTKNPDFLIAFNPSRMLFKGFTPNESDYTAEYNSSISIIDTRKKTGSVLLNKYFRATPDKVTHTIYSDGLNGRPYTQVSTYKLLANYIVELEDSEGKPLDLPDVYGLSINFVYVDDHVTFTPTTVPSGTTLRTLYFTHLGIKHILYEEQFDVILVDGNAEKVNYHKVINRYKIANPHDLNLGIYRLASAEFDSSGRVTNYDRTAHIWIGLDIYDTIDNAAPEDQEWFGTTREEVSPFDRYELWPTPHYATMKIRRAMEAMFGMKNSIEYYFRNIPQRLPKWDELYWEQKPVYAMTRATIPQDGMYPVLFSLLIPYTSYQYPSFFGEYPYLTPLHVVAYNLYDEPRVLSIKDYDDGAVSQSNYLFKGKTT